MIGREVFSVHRVCDENIASLAERDAAGVLDFAGRNRLFFRHSFVCAFEDNFTGFIADAGAIEQRGERYAGPLSCAHCAELPLNSFNRRHRKTLPFPAHSSVAVRVSDGMARSSSYAMVNGFRTAPPTTSGECGRRAAGPGNDYERRRGGSASANHPEARRAIRDLRVDFRGR